MAAPVGNKFWQCRAKHGRNGLWAKPEDLWKDCEGYFDWVEANPLWEEKPYNYLGDGFIQVVNKMRAMTLDGLTTYLGCSRATWDNYRANDDFLGIVGQVEQIIRDQKFTGAAANLLNSNIIARDLGLSDKQEISLGMTHEQWLRELDNDPGD